MGRCQIIHKSLSILKRILYFITKKKSTNPADFVVVIKPDEESTYKNAVDMLDEMTINDVKRYAMVDIAPVEFELIKKTQGS